MRVRESSEEKRGEQRWREAGFERRRCTERIRCILRTLCCAFIFPASSSAMIFTAIILVIQYLDQLFLCLGKKIIKILHYMNKVKNNQTIGTRLCMFIVLYNGMDQTLHVHTMYQCCITVWTRLRMFILCISVV